MHIFEGVFLIFTIMPSLVLNSVAFSVPGCYLNWNNVSGSDSTCRRNQSYLARRERHLFQHLAGHSGQMAVVYHAGLYCVHDLMRQWARSEGAFLVDGHYSGLEVKQVQRVLSVSTMESIDVAEIGSKSNVVHNLHLFAQTHTNFILACHHVTARLIIETAIELNMTSRRFSWTILSLDQLADIVLPVTSLQFQITLISSRASVDFGGYRVGRELVIHDAYYSHVSGKMAATKIGQWDAHNRLFMLEDFDAGDRETMLTGRFFQIVGFMHAPYSKTVEFNGTTQFDGIIVRAVVSLIRHYKATYAVRQLEQAWGNYVNGSFTGFIGRLLKREADMSFPGIGINGIRSRAVRYVAVVGKIDMGLVYRKPLPVVPPTTHVLPFEPSVWTWTAVALLVLLAALAMTAAVSPGWRREWTGEGHTLAYHLLSGSFFETALNDPPGLSGRVVYACLLLTTLLMFAVYNSVLTSFLAYQQEKKPIESVQDLATSDHYRPLLMSSGYQYDILKRSADRHCAALWRRILQLGIGETSTPNLTSAAVDMMDGRNVFIGDTATVVVYVDEVCQVVEVATPYMNDAMYFVTRLDFPYARIFYMGLLRLSERGLLLRNRKQFMTDRRSACVSDNTSSRLGFSQVFGLFFLLGCGLFSAVAVMLSERLANSKLSKRRRCLH